MKTTLSLLILLGAGCAATAQSISSEAEADAAAPDAPAMHETATTDSPSPDTSFAPDGGGVDTSISDVATDTNRPWPISAAISPMTPPARTMPRNATGVLMGAYELTDSGTSIPIRTVYFQHVGLGLAADIANVYYYAITRGSVADTPFRYSPGRAIKPVSNRVGIPFDGNLHPGATTTLLIYLDFAPGTVGAQHAFELSGVLVEDGNPEGLLIPITGVRSNMLTIGSDLAGRLDVRQDGVLAGVRANVAGEVISAQRLRANRHDLNVDRFSYAIDGDVEDWHEILDLELWRGRIRVPISEWTDPLNGHAVLAPLAPIHLMADTEEGFTIRARVTAPPGRTIRIFAEYPADVQATDRTLNAPAATCISASDTVGCDGPDQGLFDGVPGSVSETVVVP